MRAVFFWIIVGSTVVPAAGQCKESLAYLSSSIPSVQNSGLAKIRESILSTRIADVISKIRQQNLTLREASRQMLQQAAAFDEALQKTSDGIRKLSDNPDSILRKLKAREYAGLPIGESMLGAQIGTYIATDWGQEANRETAVQVACNAKNER